MVVLHYRKIQVLFGVCVDHHNSRLINCQLSDCHNVGWNAQKMSIVVKGWHVYDYDCACGAYSCVSPLLNKLVFTKILKLVSTLEKF